MRKKSRNVLPHWFVYVKYTLMHWKKQSEKKKKPRKKTIITAKSCAHASPQNAHTYVRVNSTPLCMNLAVRKKTFK